MRASVPAKQNPPLLSKQRALIAATSPPNVGAIQEPLVGGWLFRERLQVSDNVLTLGLFLELVDHL